MLARVFDGVWKENVAAAQRALDRLGRRARRHDEDPAGTRSGPRGEPRRHMNESPRREGLHRRLHRRIVGGLTAALAVLALTYSAASALVNGATGSSDARTDYAMVMQAASAEYRRARAECLALPFERRDSCIAEAHANEARMRNAATTAPRTQLSQLRKKSDQLLLAAQGRDSVVLEPACNVVARGSANVCEIQVKGRSTPEGPEALATSKAAAGALQVSADNRATMQWLSGRNRDRDFYFANVAAVIAP